MFDGVSSFELIWIGTNGLKDFALERLVFHHFILKLSNELELVEL
jgi:hypothetical protein